MGAESTVRGQRAPRGRTERLCPCDTPNHESSREPRARDGPDAPSPGRCGCRPPPRLPGPGPGPPWVAAEAANEHETRGTERDSAATNAERQRR